MKTQRQTANEARKQRRAAFHTMQANPTRENKYNYIKAREHAKHAQRSHSAAGRALQVFLIVFVSIILI